MKAVYAVFILQVTVWLLAIGGWFTNLVWVFRHLSDDFAFEHLVAILGVFAAPLGVVHGIFVWF